MKTALSRCLYVLSAVGIASLAAHAVPAAAQETVFPVAPEEVIDLPDGSTVEVYKGTVQHVSGNRLTVRFPGGAHHTYTVPPDYRFNIGGREVRARDLNRGDELTAYVTKHPTADHELVIIEEIEEDVYEVVESVTPEPVADSLPSTASPMPLVGLAGLLSAGIGLLGLLGLRLRRRLRA